MTIINLTKERKGKGVDDRKAKLFLFAILGKNTRLKHMRTNLAWEHKISNCENKFKTGASEERIFMKTCYDLANQ